MIVHIHKKDDLISSMLPFQELTNEVSFEEGMRRDVPKTMASDVPTMLRPDSVPTMLHVSP
jgi:hypothetical protein